MKPTKRQLSIIRFLAKLDSEGQDYALTQYGMDDYLKEIDDENLNYAVEKYKRASEALEEVPGARKNDLERSGISDEDWGKYC